jgi:hypothetical protein
MANPIFFSDYTTAELVAATNDSQTTILISDPTGDPLPSEINDEEGAYAYITVVDQPSYITNQNPPTQREIMKVTAWSTVSTGVSMTVVRGITTTPQIWAVGSVMELRPCAQALEDLKDTGTQVQAQYVVMATNAGLTSERVLTAGTNVTITDGGAKGAVTINATGGSGATGATGATGSAGATGATGATGIGGVLRGAQFTADDTWEVPTDVSSIWLTMTGGGGGGASRASTTLGGGSGGGAELCEQLGIFVVPGDVLVISIGAGGTGGTANGAGSSGGTTSVTTVDHSYYAVGGAGGSQGSNGVGGGTGGQLTAGTSPIAESNSYFGGSIGGRGAAGYPTPAATGATSGSQQGGVGGANSSYGLGGAGGDGNQDGHDAPAGSYGAGGGGSGAKAVSGSQDGGDGQDGYVLIQWIN